MWLACIINEIFTLNSCENLCDLKKKQKTFLQILFLDLNSLFIKSDFSKTTTFNFEFSYAEICAFLYADKSVFSELIMCILDNKVCFKNNSRRISDGNI